MSVTQADTGKSVEGKGVLLFFAFVAVSLITIAYLFSGSFADLEHTWANQEEYSHGYMIPLVAVFLFWKKLPDLMSLDWKPSRLAPVLMLLVICGWALGELTAYRQIVSYSFIGALVALVLAIFGWKGLRASWGSYFYLLFMIPLPLFLYQRLSAELQLISTNIGVAVVDAFGISVYVAGNVIDLGGYQLQVVEACSGLTYLFPLMSFGFLISYLYQGPNWHRILIFFSTIPVTVLMNSFRIGVIGVTVEYWGIEMAEGFLHDFEGWFVFMACLAVLTLEMWLLNLFSSNKKPIIDLIDLSYPTLAEVKQAFSPSKVSLPILAVVVAILVLAVPASIAVTSRIEQNPERNEFIVFPLLRGEWVGRETSLDQETLGVLKLTDYIIADYQHPDEAMPVNFYVAYYESQKKGSSIHSPRSCIPGGGWEITELTEEKVGEPLGFSDLNVNRMIITLGEKRQLVYYWFAQRGRVVTSEYLAKWYLLVDGLTMQRSDGALVRLVTPVPPGSDIAESDARLQQFLRDFYPILPRYLPGATATTAEQLQ